MGGLLKNFRERECTLFCELKTKVVHMWLRVRKIRKRETQEKKQSEAQALFLSYGRVWEALGGGGQCKEGSWVYF